MTHALGGDERTACGAFNHVLDLGHLGLGGPGFLHPAGFLAVERAFLSLNAAQPLERVPHGGDGQAREQQFLDGKSEHGAF